jgi:predicted metalloprotease with PDZ domain
MPFVDDPWMGEGWVTYYTEVLRTRIGHRGEEEGWNKLWRGFRRGARRRGEASLGRASKSMGRLGSYQTVYWGGAAMAFLMDVELRLATDGEKSLDAAVQEIRRCCGDAKRKLTAHEILVHLDKWYGGEPLFTRTAKVNLKLPFPDVEAGFERLGISIEGDGLRFDDSHPATKHRRAIMLGDDAAQE